MAGWWSPPAGRVTVFFAVFASAVSAVEAAGACQLRLGTEAWPASAALRVRMGLHTGDAQVQQGDYVDHAPINRCARVKAAAHGGQVLVTKTTHDLVGGRLGGGFGLKRLGEFRLRDLAEPELIYQLTHVGLPADFPPLVTLAKRTGNLPLPVSSFIGRARELEQTAAALGQARVVTLTGPGGVGKTRLALQAAAQVAPRFGDGAWLCELAPIRDPAGVDDAVAAVFSVTARAGQSTRQTLVEYLRGKQPCVTLMIVLPGIRRLGANADGASASGRTAPLIGFSRPDRTRSARSASRNRSGSTTKKIARPSAGHTFGGPTIVTSVPPARISGAERSRTSPPITSNATSTSPASSSGSACRSTNASAPRPRTAFRS